MLESPKKQSPRSPFRRWLRRLGGVLAAILVIFIIVNLIEESPPPPLWTVDDLPALPSESDNGWVEIRDHAEVLKTPASSQSESATTAVRQAVRDARSDKTMTRAELATRLSQVRQAAGQLREPMALCRRAIARPRFVNSCPVGPPTHPDTQCPSPLLVLACADFGHFEVLEMASQERFDEAGVAAATLLRKHLDYAASPRTLVDQMVALSIVKEDLYLAEALSRWSEPHALAPLRRQVASLQRETIRLELAAIREYLHVKTIIEQMAADPSRALLLGGGDTMPRAFTGVFDTGASLLLDEGATLRQLNELYSPMREGRMFAARGYERGFGWWFENATGKFVLAQLAPDDSGRSPLLSAYQDARDSCDEIFELRTRVLKKLGA